MLSNENVEDLRYYLLLMLTAFIVCCGNARTGVTGQGTVLVVCGFIHSFIQSFTGKNAMDILDHVIFND
jgi:hypothetical protein